MARYFAGRLGQSILLVWLVLTITFFLLHLAPGDPMARYDDPEMDPETVEMIRRQFGLDRSVPEQYVMWVSNFARGDFGISLRYNRPVTELLAGAVPNTLRLTVAALAVYIILGVALGVTSAARKDSLFDRSGTIAALVVYSIPSFWLALMLIMVFSLKLGWLPSSHMQSIDVSGLGAFELFLDRALHLVLPAFVLGVASAAGIARFMRGSMIDELRRDYVRTARAKGLSEKTVLMKHAFRNAAIPIVTIVGLSFPFLLGGSVVTERIFSWPGMGSLMVESIFTRDYPVILAINFIVSVMVILGNLLSDLGYALLDPRITWTEGRKER
jgi:peptide/nickel transport system permease protein